MAPFHIDGVTGDPIHKKYGVPIYPWRLLMWNGAVQKSVFTLIFITSWEVEIM